MRDSALTRSQRVDSAEDESSGSPARGEELIADSLCQCERSAAVGQVKRSPQDVAALSPLSRTPQRRTQVCHCSSELQARARSLERAHRLMQQLNTPPSAFSEACRA